MTRHMGAVLLVTTLSGMLTVSCAPKGSASDQTVTTDIQAKLFADNTTKGSNVVVAVKNGEVTLSGDVPTSDVELQAMKIANGASGVTRVNDQMKVNAAAAAAPLPPVGATETTSQQQRTLSASAPNESSSSYPPVSSTPLPSGPPPVSPMPPVSGSNNPPVAVESTRPVAPPEPVFVTIPAGDRLSVRMIDAIDTKNNAPGQSFRASLDSPLIANDRVIVPAGSPATVLLDNSRAAGRIKGSSELAVRVTSIGYQGHQYPVNSSVYEEQGKARGKQTAIRTGIGAAAGALIGGLAGGGKGAAIGSAAGGGAGLGVNVFTHGQQVKIPSETLLTFRLEAPLRIERRR